MELFWPNFFLSGVVVLWHPVEYFYLSSLERLTAIDTRMTDVDVHIYQNISQRDRSVHKHSKFYLNTSKILCFTLFTMRRFFKFARHPPMTHKANWCWHNNAKLPSAIPLIKNIAPINSDEWIFNRMKE